MRIPLLYRGEYSQWVERFMNYLEEQMDGEAMINLIKNGDQPLPRVTQMSIAGTSSTEKTPLKDKSMWSDQKKKIQKIDRLARSLLIQGLQNDIYSLIDSNKTAKDLWDALASHMLSSEYKWKQYATMMRQNKKNIDALYNILKQNQGDVNDVMGLKKKTVVVTSDPLALIAEKTKVSKSKEKVAVSLDSEGSDADDFTKDCKKAKVKGYNYYKTKMLLAKKDSDEQVLVAEDQAWMESSSNSDQEINANMLVMAQIEKVLSDSDVSSLSAEETIAEVAYYTSKSESEYEFKTSEYYDNSTNYGLFVNNDDDQENFHDVIESASENFIKNHIDYQKNYDRDLKNTVLEKDFKFSVLEECVCNKDLEIEKCLERLNVCENKHHKIGQTNQTAHMIMPSKDTLYNGRKGIGFENPSYFEKAKDLRPSLYDEKVIGLGYTLMFLTHSDEALEIEKFKRARENKIEFAYDYGNLNASYVNEKIKFSDDYFKSHSKLNKDVKRYSRNDLLSCNNSHLGETSSAYIFNDAMNVSCNSRLCDSFDENNLFIFDDESVRISSVSKMPFRKKPRDSMNHMTGNRALLANFVEKFLGTVRFGNNDFAVIAGYGDVGLEVAFRKSTCFVRTEDGVDLLTDDRSSNLYAISLNEVASNSSTCLLAKASSLQSWLWHQHLSHLNFATINNLVKNNLVQGLPKMKFEKDHLCSAYKQRKIHQKHHKSKTAFASNKPLYILHMDLCGPMRVESINGKRYVLVVVDDYSRYTWRVRTDNGTEFKNKTLAKFFDEVGISQQFSAVRTPQQNGVVERRNRTLVEAKAQGKRGFRIYNKRTCKIHESVNVNVDEVSEMASKQFSLEPDLSNLNETGKSSNPSVLQVSKISKKDLEDLFQNFYDEYFDSSKIMKSSTTNLETSNVEIPSNEEEVFHESFESFQEGSSSSSLNDDEVYFGQPPGFVSKQYPDHVYALDKALYGLKLSMIIHVIHGYSFFIIKMKLLK
nr:hypothetical protein [Tanacetum cinerariifolium]